MKNMERERESGMGTDERERMEGSGRVIGRQWSKSK